MASLHANSAREALVKMCTLPLLAGETYQQRKQIARDVVRDLKRHEATIRRYMLPVLSDRRTDWASVLVPALA